MDHLNENIDKEIMEIRTTCSSIMFCHKQECNFHRSITQVSVSTGTFFTLKYILPLHPSFHITTTHLSLVEFLTYMFSIVSTWTGLSIFSMNPSIFVARTITAFQKNTDGNVSHDEAGRVVVIEAKFMAVK